MVIARLNQTCTGCPFASGLQQLQSKLASEYAVAGRTVQPRNASWLSPKVESDFLALFVFHYCSGFGAQRFQSASPGHSRESSWRSRFARWNKTRCFAHRHQCVQVARHVRSLDRRHGCPTAAAGLAVSYQLRAPNLRCYRPTVQSLFKGLRASGMRTGSICRRV